MTGDEHAIPGDIELSPDDKKQFTEAVMLVYDEQVRVDQLLRTIDYPPARIPRYNIASDTWFAVFRELDNGIIERPFRRLLEQVHAEYGGNDVFRRLVTRYLPKTGKPVQTPNEPPEPGGSEPPEPGGSEPPEPGGGVLRRALGSRQGRLLIAAGAFVGLVSLVLGLIALLPGHKPVRGSARPGPCADTPLGGRKGNERVGFITSACSPHASLNEIAKRIEQQNADIPESLPHRTVVFFEPLTTVSEKSVVSVNAASFQQLYGLALAQQQATEAAKQRKGAIALRVLLANSGDRFFSGLSVAQQINARATADHNIVAVIGIGQSRRQSYEAIQKISGAAGLPVIGTSVTGDNMTLSSKSFFRLSPTNMRQAWLVAQYARHRLKAGSAALLYNNDTDDLFSFNLETDFKHAFTDIGGRIVAECQYRENADANCGGGDIKADQLFDHLCKIKPDVVFYASRAQQLPQLLQQSRTCRHPIAVLGSSDVPKEMSDFRAPPNIHLHYVSFGVWKQGKCGKDAHLWQTDQECRFVRDFSSYRRTFKDSPPEASNDAVFGFDVLNTVLQASAKDPQANDREAIMSALSTGIEFDGASGHIILSAARGEQTPPSKPVFIFSVDAKGNSTNQSSCGWFGTKDKVQVKSTTWHGHPCPTVP